MNFCSNCGEKVALAIPEGDDRERHVCGSCGSIHYSNPRIICGMLATQGDKVLMCKRAIEPQYGLWTLPAGFYENGESLQAGACREAWEEATAKIINTEFYRVFDLPFINQVYVFFRGELEGGCAPGAESLETVLMSESEIPWDQMAFSVMTDTLSEFFADRKAGSFPVRMSEPSDLWLKHGNKPRRRI